LPEAGHPKVRSRYPKPFIPAGRMTSAAPRLTRQQTTATARTTDRDDVERIVDSKLPLLCGDDDDTVGACVVSTGWKHRGERERCVRAQLRSTTATDFALHAFLQQDCQCGLTARKRIKRAFLGMRCK
jgi:hypothetical protein